MQFFERLGFDALFQDDPTNPRYAVVAREGAELHLQWQDSTQWAYPMDRPTYRFLVSDVDALYLSFRGTNALAPASERPSPWATPGDTPWGTREFHLLDPDGNGLQFYQPSTRATADV